MMIVVDKNPQIIDILDARSGEAVAHRILPASMVSQLFLVVALSMALTPFLATFGQRLGKIFEKNDMKAGSFISSPCFT